MFPPKKDPKEKAGEVYGLVLVVLTMTVITLLLLAPAVWLLRHVYSWALGL